MPTKVTNFANYKQYVDNLHKCIDCHSVAVLIKFKQRIIMHQQLNMQALQSKVMTAIYISYYSS